MAEDMGGKVEELVFILRAGSLWKVLAGASNNYISILSEWFGKGKR